MTKTCEGCGKEYSARSASQRRCADCVGSFCLGCSQFQPPDRWSKHDNHHCKSCRNDYQRDYQRRNPGKGAEKIKNRRLRQRRVCLEHYGGTPPSCACCQESHYEFLILDHKDGGGNEHRRTVCPGDMYAWAIREGFPPIFRVLCANCNHALGAYGLCPHQESPSVPRCEMPSKKPVS